MKGHNGAVFCSLLFNNVEKKAVIISWRGGGLKPPHVLLIMAERRNYCTRGMSEAGDKIPIITSFIISAFLWGSETILSKNVISFLPEPSKTHCFFPAD